MRTKIIFLVLFLLNSISNYAQQTEIKYLSGTGSDNTVDWEFFCTKGRNSGKWTTIPVPSCWELQGFGGYNYGHDIHIDKQDSSYLVHDEHGKYKYKFMVPADWSGKKVNIVFEGSMTDTEVKINGQSAGAIHQGAFYRFKYNISNLLKYGEENLLEVEVSKLSSNHLVNMAERKADYWVFGGIFRPVFLEALPSEHISHFAIDAKANGQLSAHIDLENIRTANKIIARIKTMDGQQIDKFYISLDKKQTEATISGKVPHVKTWNPETPKLYQLEISLYQNETLLHKVTDKIGFRNVEVRKHDGIYVNDSKIRMKGVNRHSFYPSTGRTTCKKMSIEDVELIKEMNMNAVRMSHYPPDVHFLDVCDSLGLFVLDELAGWQWPSYDTEVGKKLVKEMVERDVNHPCIILWDNGNEGGWNYELDAEFAKYDPQKRHVIHPWEVFDGTDAQHYKPYGYGTGSLFNGDDIFFPTEFLHGLYDGGHGAGLEDYWDLMTRNPLSAGGFLWVFSDEAVVRTDKDNILDTDGNHAPDGIVGPYREKEGSFYAIKEIWSPVVINRKYITPEFDGLLEVENQYIYTNLNQCEFKWKLVNFPSPFDDEIGSNIQLEGTAKAPSIPAAGKGFVNLDLPPTWTNSDALILSVNDPHGKEIYTYSWNIKKPMSYAELASENMKKGEFEIKEKETNLVVKQADLVVEFDKTNGKLKRVDKNNQNIPFGNGPSIDFVETEFKELKHYQKEDKYIVEVFHNKGFKQFRWEIQSNGWIKLYYAYRPGKGHFDFLGINFDFPENEIKGVKYLGNGPYRVWKNRLKGVELDVFEKEYNNTITGSSWQYPEFKGYYSNFHWAEFKTNSLPFTVICATDNIYLRLFTPEFQENAKNAQASFPEGNISFLHAIPPIGTKFHVPKELGPMSQKNMYWGWERTIPPFEGELFFYFGSY